MEDVTGIKRKPPRGSGGEGNSTRRGNSNQYPTKSAQLMRGIKRNEDANSPRWQHHALAN